MARLGSEQVAGTLHLIPPSLKFHNVGSTPASSQGLGGSGGDAGALAAVQWQRERSAAFANGLLNGNYKRHVTIFSAQLAYAF